MAFRALEKKLLHIVGYNKNAESEGVKQDAKLMNASEIGKRFFTSYSFSPGYKFFW